MSVEEARATIRKRRAVALLRLLAASVGRLETAEPGNELSEAVIDEAGMDWLILEVKASMPCYRYGDESGADECSRHPTEQTAGDYCPSCQARAELAAMSAGAAV